MKTEIQAGFVPPAALEWTRANYGISALSVHERAISMLRAQAQNPPSLKLDVNGGVYSWQGVMKLFYGGVSPQFSPPTSGTRLDILYLNCATGELAIAQGTAAVNITDPLNLPTVPEGCIPLAAVHLGPGQESITETDLYDLRPFLGSPWGSGTTGHVLTKTASGAAWQAVAAGVLAYNATQSNTAITTTSTSWVDMMSVNITVSQSALILLLAQMTLYNSAQRIVYAILTDNSNNALGVQQYARASSDDYPLPVNLSFYTLVSAGSHTFKVRWKVQGFTGTASARSFIAIAWRV